MPDEWFPITRHMVLYRIDAAGAQPGVGPAPAGWSWPRCSRARPRQALPTCANHESCGSDLGVPSSGWNAAYLRFSLS
jgi:hypothetical protein